MPEANKEYRNFIGGLVTEATPVNAPDDAVKDIQNLVLNRDGSISRRFGIDYEAGYTKTTATETPAQFINTPKTVFLWEGADQDADVDILVVQVGPRLYLFDANKSDVSSNPLLGGTPLGISLIVTAGPLANQMYSYTVVAGVLVISTGDNWCTYVKYDSVTDTASIERYGLLVRDFWGIDDFTAPGERPDGSTAVTVAHEYNLRNQGWNSQQLIQFVSDQNTYPSNSDLVTLGIDDTDDKQFKPKLVARSATGTSPAPKGRIILDLLERGASRTSGTLEVTSTEATDYTSFQLSLQNNLNKGPAFTPVTISWGEGNSGWIGGLVTGSGIDVPVDRTTGGISVNAPFGGRVFYAGFGNSLVGGDTRSPLLGSFIAFSQVAENPSKLGLCHQGADPTSSEQTDIIASDGGVVNIAGAAKIVQLVPTARSLVIFATNGVWEISGGPDSVFSATQFEVSKLSSVGTNSPHAVVSAEGSLLYWADGGVYIISADEASGRLASNNLSESKIRSFYNAIPGDGIAAAVGVYDSPSKVVRWLYSASGNVNVFDSELILDLSLGSWYTAAYDPSVAVLGAYSTPSSLSLLDEATVTVGGVVVTASAVPVTVTSSVSSGASTSTKYIVSEDATSDFTAAELNNPRFLDWETETVTGVDAAGYFQTWEDVFDDTARNKQAKYITCTLSRTETSMTSLDGIGVDLVNTSSCLVTPYWDYADNIRAGRQFEAYRLTRMYLPAGGSDPFDYGVHTISTKSKIRGRGKALALRMETAPSKDLQLLSWSLNLTGNTNV